MTIKAPQRVVWSEGMFMSPHHLQQQDLYHEALLETRINSLVPYTFGIFDLKFDLEALRAGDLQLEHFSGVLPDGLPVAFERGDAEAPAARPVEEHFGPAQRVVEIFLGIPKERSGVESYRGPDQVGGNPRFLPTDRDVNDMSVSTSIVKVAFAQRNLALLFDDEPRDDHDTLKLCELTRDRSGNLELVPNYIPPCLQIAASDYLVEQVRNLLRLVIAKQRQLSQRRKQRDAAAVEFTASDVTLFLELHALNGIIPVLQHALETGNLRPRDLYLELIRFAGQLCTFVADQDPSGLPPFQFLDLRATFEVLFGTIQRLLRYVAIERSVVLEMKAGPDRLYRAKLEDERLGRCGQFLLAVRAELPEKTVAEQLPRLAKIAGWSEIGGLVQATSPGVPVEPAYRPPPEVSVEPGVVYFQLSMQDTFWRNAMRERTLALYLPNPFDVDRTTIELHAIPTISR